MADKALLRPSTIRRRSAGDQGEAIGVGTEPGGTQLNDTHPGAAQSDVQRSQAASGADDGPLLSIRGLSKRFAGTQALKSLDLDVRAGEIHALLGENGAGKSTLIKILAGVFAADEGAIFLGGAAVRPTVHGLLGVAFIHQDLALVDSMSVMENIGHVSGFPRRRGLISWPEMRRDATRILATMQADIDPTVLVSQLSQAQKSIVAIVRAVATHDVRMLVLDEPTASLAEADVARVFRTLQSLKGRHVGILFVTHRLDEVFRIADRVTVLRDGRHVVTTPIAAIDRPRLVEAIIGKPSTEVFVRESGSSIGDAVVEFDGVTVGSTGPCTFSVSAGEVVALVGLQGAGQNDIGRALVGDTPRTGGTIRLKGKSYAALSAGRSIALGVGFISSKRSEESLALRQTIRENLFANPSIPNREPHRWIGAGEEVRDTHDLMSRYRVRASDSETTVASLSGGNQQKVVLARWLSANRDLLVLEEPTMGVDVGAKAEIYRLLRESLHRGLAVMLISSDFEEVAGIATRALVFHRGRITAELRDDDLMADRLVRAAFGPASSRNHSHA